MRVFPARRIGFACMTMALLVCAAYPVQAQGKKWALLVGINKYENNDISTLNFAVADVKAVGQTLRTLGFENIFVMTSDVADPKNADYPTASNILERLQTFANQIKPEDTFLFYFSGHGFQKGQDSKQQFLGTINANPTNAQTLRVSTLPMDVLGDQMKTIKAGRVVYVIDACRIDPDKNKGGTPNIMQDGFLRSLKNAVLISGGAGAKGSAVLCACSVGEYSYEWPAFHHGVFTYYLLEGLKGKAADKDGRVTVDTLAAYVKDQVQKWDDETNHLQHPAVNSEGIIVLGRVNGGSEIDSQIVAVIVREPGLVGASKKSIMSYFDEDAMVRDVWHSGSVVQRVWQDGPGDTKSIWKDAKHIVARYQDLDETGWQHREIQVSAIRTNSGEKVALATSWGFNVREQKRTNPEIWILRQKGGTWRVVRFYYDIPPKYLDDILTTKKQEFDSLP